MDTRKQDLEALQEMQRIKGKIDRIDRSLAEIERGIDSVYIDEDLYDTNHAEECEREEAEKQEKTTNEYAKKQKGKLSLLFFVPFVGIAVTFAVAFLTKIYFLAAILFIASFIVAPILASVIKKRILAEREEAIRKISKEYEEKLKQARKEDEKKQHRYTDDLSAAYRKYHEEHRDERERLEAEKAECKKELANIRIISESDMPNINQLIRLLESNRASNVKEALQELDNQQRLAEEKKRREAEEKKRRKAEEEARRAAMPGRVHVRIGSINTYSGALQTVRNTIYFDGAQYGYGDATGNTVFQLNPGVHNVYAQLAEAGYLFTTPTQSFVLQGDGDAYLKITIRNARANIYLCSSESDFWSN